MASQRLDVHIERVACAEEIPLLAEISEEALKPDSFYDAVTLYGPLTPLEAVTLSLQNAMAHPSSHFVFKAVLGDAGPASASQQIIAGWAHWTVGYIEIPKVDPFDSADEDIAHNGDANSLLPVAEATVQNEAKSPINVVDDTKQELDMGKAAFEKSHIDIWNGYIRSIRGKKHIYLRRVVVLPQYQRQGIATKLLRWGAEYSDREGIVGWLNARPAGLPMYRKAGWVPVNTVSYSLPDVHVAPVVQMLRKPQNG